MRILLLLGLLPLLAACRAEEEQAQKNAESYAQQAMQLYSNGCVANGADEAARGAETWLKHGDDAPHTENSDFLQQALSNVKVKHCSSTQRLVLKQGVFHVCIERPSETFFQTAFVWFSCCLLTFFFNR